MTEDDNIPEEDVYVPQVAVLPVTVLQLNGWNPNEQSETTFQLLVENIKQVGFIEPLQVVPVTGGLYRIIGGAHRFQAAQILGMSEVPCVVLSDKRWADEDLQKFVTVRLNNRWGKANSERMIALYREMSAKYGEKSLQRMFAYTEDEAWKKLVRQVKKSLKASGLPEEAKKKFAKASEGVDSAEELGIILNKILNEHGDTLKHSFLVFSFGGKEHLYIAMSEKTRKSLEAVTTFCQEWGRDINQVIADVTKDWVLAAKRAESEALEGDDAG